MRLSEQLGTRALAILTQMYADENYVPRYQDAVLKAKIGPTGSKTVIESFDGDLIRTLDGEDTKVLTPFAELEGFEANDISITLKRTENRGPEGATLRFTLSDKGKDLIREHLFETRYSTYQVQKTGEHDADTSSAST